MNMINISQESAFERGNRLATAGQHQEAIAAFDACLQENAQDWQALSNRGNARFQLKQYPQALQDYMQAATLQPTSANIKCNLAALLKELGEMQLAESLLREALQHEPGHVDAWSNLGVLLQYRLQYADSIHCHLQALELGGPSFGRLNNLGNAYTCALQLDKAEASYRQALQISPQNGCLAFNLAIVLFLLGRYAEAWPLYEGRWQTMMQPRYLDKPWQGQELGSQHLLIWAEQGLGDTLQLVRLLPILQTRYPQARLTLACQSSLLRLFRQFDGIQVIDLESAAPEHDWQIPQMSLPLYMGLTLSNLSDKPYLAADPALAEVLRPALPAESDKRLRIGVVWETGKWGVGIADHGRQNKSVPPEQFLPLLETPDIDFVSLQLGDIPAVLQDKLCRVDINDFADTAAIVSQLDLVISVDTSVVHLVGALGKPVWVLMRAESAPFFMASGESSPWYASMYIWRQETAGDWPPLIEHVAKTLRNLREQ